MPKALTVTETMGELGLSRTTVLALIRSGAIRGFRFGAAVRVDAESVERYKARCEITPAGAAQDASAVVRLPARTDLGVRRGKQASKNTRHG